MTVKKIGYVEQGTRWKVTVVYNVTKKETLTVIHHIWELEELQELIENGPTFCAIKSFKIDYCGRKETIKEASES